MTKFGTKTMRGHLLRLRFELNDSLKWANNEDSACDAIEDLTAAIQRNIKQLDEILEFEQKQVA
jgi:hypothetical protein